MREKLAHIKDDTGDIHSDALSIKELRSKIVLSQPKFAALLHVDVGTLRNWEQGRSEPTGPPKALLAAIRKDPVHVGFDY